MPAFLYFLGGLVSQNRALAYFVIYAATIFFGNTSAFISFWFAINGFLGSMGLPFLLITIFAAEFTGDILWYSVGKKFHETKFGNFIRGRFVTRNSKIEKSIAKNGYLLIFISKFLYGSALPTVFLSGWTNFPMKKFIKTSLLSLIVWIPVLSVLAFSLFSWLAPIQALAAFKNYEITFLISIGLFILIEYAFMKLAKIIFAEIFKNGKNGCGNQPSAVGPGAVLDGDKPQPPLTG